MGWRRNCVSMTSRQEALPHWFVWQRWTTTTNFQCIDHLLCRFTGRQDLFACRLAFDTISQIATRQVYCDNLKAKLIWWLRIIIQILSDRILHCFELLIGVRSVKFWTQCRTLVLVLLSLQTFSTILRCCLDGVERLRKISRHAYKRISLERHVIS